MKTPLVRFLALTGVAWVPTALGDHFNTPLLSIVQFPEDSEFTVAEPIPFVATINDTDHNAIDRVDFFANGQRLGEATRSPDTPGERDVIYHFVWADPAFGDFTVQAKALTAGMPQVASQTVSFSVLDAHPTVSATVSLTVIEPYAIEGHPANYGLYQVSRSGTLDSALTVAFETVGSALRETDYWLELNPCQGCTQPPMHITENAIVFQPGNRSVTVGVRANFEFNAPEEFVEPVLENVIFRLLSAPVEEGEMPPYTLGFTREAEVQVVDQPEASAPTLTIISPADDTMFGESSEIPIKVLGISPFFDAEVFANGNRIGHASFCPPLADCAPPKQGEVIELSFYPEDEFFAGNWANIPPGDYAISARTFFTDERKFESNVVNVRVVDRASENDAALAISQLSNGTIQIGMPSIAGASRFQLDASNDLIQWTRIGELNAGIPNVIDVNAGAMATRFYRAQRP